MNANDGFFIPFGLRKGVLPIFHLDNSDFAEDSDVTTQSINSDLQRGLDRRLRHTTLNTEQNQLAIKLSADNLYYRNANG